MRLFASAVLVLSSCAGLACSSSDPEAPELVSDELEPVPAKRSPEPTEPPKPPEPPAWLLLPWDTKIRVAPEQYAPALTLTLPTDADRAADDRGRVIRVVGKADPEGRWWKLETGSLDGDVAGLPIEGLDFYALSLYVPAGTGEAAPAGGPPPDPTVAREVAIEAAVEYGMIGLLSGAGVLTQSGQPRPPKLAKEWLIDADAKVYWPDGSVAGTVRQRHAFIEAGGRRKLAGRELQCFAIRVGPPKTSPTQLCFEPAAVHESKPTDAAELSVIDYESDAHGGLIGVDYDVYEGAGLGLIGAKRD